MAKKLIDTDVKLGKNTVLVESFSDPVVKTTLNSGESRKLGNFDSIGGVTVWYTLIGNNYLSMFFIPKELFNEWFYESNAAGSMYVRINTSTQSIQVSDASAGYGRVRAYQLIY